MYQVKRAIVLAAGMGSRMRPVTFITPKPMVDVNGTRIIETVINGLINNGILEIYVVVGYLKESFEKLKNKYSNLVFLENPYYESCNSISSLYVARNYIEEAIIIDGDQYIYNDKILSAGFERSGYNAAWTDDETNEWLMQIDEKGIVTSCSRIGGKRGWQLYGISRWSAEDGRKLKEDLEYEFAIKENRDIYWDDVAMFCYPEHYELGIRRMNKSDIIEIDSLAELASIDKKYEIYL